MKTFLTLIFSLFMLPCFGQGLKISQYPNTNILAPSSLFIVTMGATNMNIRYSDLLALVGTNRNGVFITNINNFSWTSNLYVTNMWATNIYIAGTVVNDWTFTTNFYTVNNYSSNIFASWEYVTNLYVTTNYTYFSYITNLYDQRAYITTNINDYNYTTNLYATNIYVQNFYATNPAQFGSNIYVSGFVFAGWVVVTNYVQADTIYIGDLFVTNCPPATNYTTVLSGTNTLVELTTTNNTNFYKVNSTGGGSITNLGVVVTNIEYLTNLVMDMSFVQNDYYMTNSMTNAIHIRPTNMLDGSVFSLSLAGANAVYTNYAVFFTWPPSVTVTWLSITNGAPTTLITSNKVQFYSFQTRMSSIKTNIIAAFKEEI